MNRHFVTALTALTLAVAPLAASAQVTPGTNLTGTINQTLDSGHAQVGQAFTMSNVHSDDNNIVGATIYGHVTDVVKAGQGRPGSIQLGFNQLVTRSGGRYYLTGRVTNMTVNTKNNALKEVGGAVAGMIVGNILGKAVGTNLGGAVGAGGGYLAAKNNRSQVTIPQNSAVTVQVVRSRRQA
jgi:hypothetical protein